MSAAESDTPSTPEGSGWPWLVGKLYGVLSRNPRSNRVVAEAAELQPGERVLDIGCGAGKALLLAAEMVGAENCFGIDPTKALVDTARKRLPGASIAVGMAEDLPFADDSFDVVWTIASPHHWDDRHRGLKEVARVLKPGGRFLLAEQLRRADGGHGLSESEAAATAKELERIGFERTQVLRPRIKWYTLLILRSWAPRS